MSVGGASLCGRGIPAPTGWSSSIRLLHANSGRAMNGISIALIIHSLDYYYKPTSAIQIDGLNSYDKILVRIP